MPARRDIPFAIIGCGLMGRELASAAARFDHLTGLDFRPRLVMACDTNPAALGWFQDAMPGLRTTTDFRQVLDAPDVSFVYAAVPHHLHQDLYIATLAAGKHLLGEKPFGIDRAANACINAALRTRPDLTVRCSSEFPFYPGAQRIFRAAREGAFGRILDVRSGLLHSSDLDPQKPINWKRIARQNGEYGCLGDLGLHAVHLPFRLGWHPRDVRALLTKIVERRPDHTGNLVRCDTWDNAVLACMVGSRRSDEFPLLFETKRMAPGHMNTWFIEVAGTKMSARFTTQRPRTLETMSYERGRAQAWQVEDLGYAAAYPAITGGIFEFGFPDAILQMLAAYCDELWHGTADMRQPFTLATPHEVELSHHLFDAALISQRTGATVAIEPLAAGAAP